MQDLWRRQGFRLWLAVAGASTLVLGAAYSMVQQEARLSANVGPITTAESAKHLLESGSRPEKVIVGQKANLRSDYHIFSIVTDTNRRILASSAQLDGKTPLPPKGVFDYTAKHGSEQITWEPAKDVRLAIYTTTYKFADGSGYIISGQPLKITEDRIGKITLIAITAWVIIIAWVSLILLLPKLRSLIK
jgi:hypothetical protein